MTLATEITRGARRAADAGAEDFARFRSRLDKGIRHARKNATRRVEATDRYVHQHPWTSLAVAAGIGAVAAIVAASLLRRDHY